MIKKIPIPVAGLSLGFAALGNLLQSYSESIRLVCGAISAVLAIMFLCKCIFHFDMVKEDMKNPVMASVSGTFSMAVILLSAYAKPFIGSGAVYIWYFGIALHILLMLYFTERFLYRLNMKTVFASYYIVYVGIVTASVTAPAFGRTRLGTGIFWFGLIWCLILLVLVTARYVKYKEIAEPARPLFCIYTAPVSLCLAGYLQSAEAKSMAMVLFLMVLAGILYITVLVYLPRFLALPFYPSYAAFTFPVVISAIAMKMSTAFLAKMGYAVGVLPVIVLAETVIAVCLVVYVFIRYMKFLFSR
ncbi:TDT family transporter [Lacrimispora celerecrescens]|uniref:Exfoliative toxin A/B n=1 Tax=[Clostridium] celerecrescens 18A TaxID=1286362 RepID=A0A2M8Z760_9FIRM|nr:TDT family transporter [Lacrimispora celerecrescens]PJJ29284.1 exfoliative toxin A/B [[Clostridium] celerecrescens 18A]